MKPFRFSLETLLNVRSIKEKQELSKLSMLIGERSRILGLLGNLKTQYLKQAEIVKNLDPTTPESFQAQKSYYHLENLIHMEEIRIKADLEQINEKITLQQKAVLEKSSEKKVVEKFREKAEEQYKIEVRREENLINDDNNQNLWQWKKERFA